jgi:TolA-binding protein
MINALSQLEALKETPYYVPFVMIALAFGAFVGGYKWMRVTTKAELAETVLNLQSQINDLARKIKDLENGRSKASKNIVFALETLPQSEQNTEGRKFLHAAIDALSGSTSEG